MAHEYALVALERDEEGYPQEIGIRRVAAERAQVVTIPLFVDALAAGDVVEVREVDDRLWVTRVVEESDRWLARLMPLGGRPTESVAEAFRALGCGCTASAYGVVGVEVGPQVDADAVVRVLERGFAAGKWDYETPVAPRGQGRVSGT